MWYVPASAKQKIWSQESIPTAFSSCQQNVELPDCHECSVCYGSLALTVDRLDVEFDLDWSETSACITQDIELVQQAPHSVLALKPITAWMQPWWNDTRLSRNVHSHSPLHTAIAADIFLFRRSLLHRSKILSHEVEFLAHINEKHGWQRRQAGTHSRPHRYAMPLRSQQLYHRTGSCTLNHRVII